eukprot:5593809-Alexandrium_andersonii.AAC.1
MVGPIRDAPVARRAMPLVDDLRSWISGQGVRTPAHAVLACARLEKGQQMMQWLAGTFPERPFRPGVGQGMC